MALPQYFLQDLKARSDLSDIAASYVNLKQRGKNLVGLCPFHNEKTPSFNIYPENGSFYCFGCNTGGDIITFIMKIENLDYIEAVKFLAQRAGMELPEDGIDDSLSKLRTRILEINRETARFFHTKLYSPEGKRALAYLENRQLGTKMIKRFGLGYSPNGGFELTNHLRAKGYTAEELIQSNVAGRSRNGNPYDRFRGRVMFPIIDLRGNVVAFGGRILTDEKPKYINTSDTPVYKKSNALFAMNFAKDSGKRQLILAEGYMDVIALHKAGFTNAIASLGTALTEEQARMIARYADEIVICYDSDDAGQRAAARAIPILKRAGLYVKVLAVPGGKDPDEFITSHGEEGPLRFKALLEGAGSDTDYKLFKAREKYDTEKPDEKTKFVREAVSIIAAIDDRIERDVYAGRLAEETGIEKRNILETAESARKQLGRKHQSDQRREQSRVVAAESKINPEKAANPRVANSEEGIIAYLFSHSDKIYDMAKRLPPDSFITAFNRRIYQLIVEKDDSAELTLTDFALDLTTEEMGELTRILVTHSDPPVTSKDALEYARIIENEARKLSPDKAKELSPEEIQKLLESIKKEKQGGTTHGSNTSTN